MIETLLGIQMGLESATKGMTDAERTKWCDDLVARLGGDAVASREAEVMARIYSHASLTSSMASKIAALCPQQLNAFADVMEKQVAGIRRLVDDVEARAATRGQTAGAN